MPAYKILLMLGRSPFAIAMTEHLVNIGVEFCGMVLDEVGPAADIAQAIPIQHSSKTSTAVIDDIASKQSLLVLYSKTLSADTLQEKIEALRPDILLICCYPKILPKRIWQIAKIACVNLHPSLLPKYRGPSPLFWQLKDAIDRFGVSLHHVSDRVDGGDIIEQNSCNVVDGLKLAKLECKLGGLGGELIERALTQNLFSKRPLARQDDAQATYQSSPCASDFSLSTKWPARRVYNFLCGTEHYGHRYIIESTGKRIKVAKVLRFADKEQLPQRISNKNQRLSIQFGAGCVELIGEVQEN